MNIVDIAQAALCEAGRPDLAIGVHPNKIGAPSRKGTPLADFPIVARAFYLAHRGAGHQCHRYGESFICHTCDERSESRHYLGRGEG